MKRFQKLVFILALAVRTVAADDSVTASCTGTVVDEKGQPVSGASVECYHYQAQFGSVAARKEEPEPRQHTVTDERGAFTVSSSPGTTLVLVKKPGLAPAWKIWTPTLADSPDPLVLTAPTTLAGTVVDENNRPLAGAIVWVAGAIVGNKTSLKVEENQLFGRLARECFSALTTTDGRFRIENFPADGLAGLAAGKPGKAQRPMADGSTGGMDFRSGQDNIELMLGPAGDIEGTVAVDQTRQPLAGVELWLEPASAGLYRPQSREPVESGASGAFRIPDVQPGNYRILATMPGQTVPEWVAALYDKVTVVAGESSRDVLIYTAKGVLVEVTVVSSVTRIPVANVAVTSALTVPSARVTAYTDTNGIALLRVFPGTCYFSALSPGYLFPEPYTVGIEPGRTNHFQIKANPSPRITGQVRDPAGAPVPGALVSFHPGHYPGANPCAEARTDESGRYELILQQSPYTAFRGGIHPTNCILARSLQRNLAAVVDFVQIPTSLNLSLQPGITLSGSVKDTAGAPIIEAAVQVSFQAAASFVNVEEQPTKVDAQGAFSIPALPQGREYIFFNNGITARGYGSASGQVNPEFTHTNHYEFPPFVLKRADLMLAGQVLGLDGKPAAGATISYGGAGQRQFTTAKSDSTGHFEFNNVVEGPVIMNASRPMTRDGQVGGVVQRMPANGGDTNIVLQLRSQ